MNNVHAITPTAVLQSLKGKSLPQLIRFSDGNDYVIKFKGNPQGLKLLVHEFIASQLAELLSLPTPSFRLVHISQSFIRDHPMLCHSSFISGNQFACQYLQPCEQLSNYPPYPDRSQIINLDRIPGIVVFDYWLGNTDRSRRNLLIQKDKQGRDLVWLIDHGNCFSDESCLPPFKFRTVHKWCLSHLEDHQGIQQFIKKVQSIPDQSIAKIMDSIPDDWKVTDQEKASLLAYLVKGKNTLPKLLDELSTHFPPSHSFKTTSYLSSSKVLKTLEKAIKYQKPLSLVRIGNGENIVLSQYSILSEEEFMKTGTAKKWPKHGAGVKLPDTKTRDEVLNALKKVDLIGILPHHDVRVKTNSRYKRELTDQIFSFYYFYPKHTFDALLFRDLSAESPFWKLLKGKKVIIISKWGKKFKQQSEGIAHQYGFKISGVYPIENYYEIQNVLNQLKKADFDVALIAAGVAAIVLSQHIAEQYGKVAIDIGHGLTKIAKGKLE